MRVGSLQQALMDMENTLRPLLNKRSPRGGDAPALSAPPTGRMRSPVLGAVMHASPESAPLAMSSLQDSPRSAPSSAMEYDLPPPLTLTSTSASTVGSAARANMMLEPLLHESRRLISMMLAGAVFVATLSSSVRRKVRVHVLPDLTSITVRTVEGEATSSTIAAFTTSDIQEIQCERAAPVLRLVFVDGGMPPLELRAADAVQVQDWVTGLELIHGMQQPDPA